MKKQTELLYLKDAFVDECDSLIVDIGTDDKGLFVVVERTAFYPARGGQESEKGSIYNDVLTFYVCDTRIENDIVKHYGSFSHNRNGAMFSIGDYVIVHIDQEQRKLHSRIHSAGELLCAAIKKLGYKTWQVASAIHYETRSSVEYNQIIPEDKRDEFRLLLQDEMNKLIRESLPISLQMTDDIQIVEQLCGYKPEYIAINEPIRLVSVAGNTRPCMGSHVLSTADIGSVEITKIKVKKGQTSISYIVNQN